MASNSTDSKNHKISWLVKPQNLSLVQWQRALRRQVAQEEQMDCREVDAENLPG